MKISCTSTMIPESNLTKAAETLKKWGFDGIGVFVDYGNWSEDLHQEILKLEERTGIVPCEFAFGDRLYGHLMDADPDIRRKSREMYKLAASVCGELGAVTELEYAYGPQFPLPLFHPYARMDEEQEEAFLEMYRELIKPLKGTSGKMLLEGINRYESPYLNCLKDCKDIIEKLCDENAGLLADFFHMSIEEADIPDTLRYTADSICHVHLGDNNRLLPGWGSTDWKTCLETLQAAGYDGFLSLECSTCGEPEKTLPETVKFLRSIVG